MSGEGIINGIVQKVAMGALSKMKDDETFGSQMPVRVEAVWKGDVVAMKDWDMKMYAPPQMLSEASYPNVYNFCPVMVSSCFSLIFMIHAALKGFQFDSYEVEVGTTGDMSCIFQDSAASKVPWENVKMNVKVQGPQTEADIKELGGIAAKYCPSVQLLEGAMKLDIKANVKNTDGPFEKSSYDIKAYDALLGSSEPVMVPQKAQLKWFCKEKSEDVEDATMTLDGEGCIIALNPPMTPGKYPNPVQGCLFGGLGFHMHIIAINLLQRGFGIRSFIGIVATTLNKRKVLGVDPRASAFPTGCICFQLDIDTDAPEEIVQQVVKVAEKTSPGFLGMSNPVHLDLTLSKV